MKWKEWKEIDPDVLSDREAKEDIWASLYQGVGEDVDFVGREFDLSFISSDSSEDNVGNC